jgi:Regulator of ribonuclease activity B
VWIVVALSVAALVARYVWRPRRSVRQDSTFTKNASEDAQTLRALREAGADLSKATDVEFYLYFRTGDAAERAGHSAQLPGFSATIKPGRAGKNWLCLLSGRMVPSEDEIGAASARLQMLADSFEGNYDGWEAKVTR